MQPQSRSAVEVRSLGRKARERRQEEIKKRHEIQVIDSVEPASDETERKGIVIRAKKKPKAAAVVSRKRPSATKTKHGESPATTSTKKRRLSNSENQSKNSIDNRTPIVSHLVDLVNDEDGSNVVRVHGLPAESCPGDLYRFFAGLDPLCVFVLPTCRVHFLNWDAQDSSITRGCLERHPTWYRVFVKFASAPVASLAAKRSGEVSYLGENKSENSDMSPRQGATIAITQVPKATARYLLQNMVSSG
jgi:hypothetical protein